MSITDPPMPDDDDDPLPPPIVTGAPQSIYLNVGEIEYDCDFDELGATEGTDSVTWCTDQQFPADIRYVRADLVVAIMPVNWREDADWRPLATALGVKA